MTSIPTSILRLWSSTDSTNDGRGWTEHIQIPSKFNILLMMASQPEANQSPVELVNFCPSPPAPVSKRSATNSATPQHRLPCPRTCTGKTPGKGSSVDNPHPEFVEQCAACDRMFPSVKHDPMKKDQRMKCSVCKRGTSNFCWKCCKYLCNEPPLNGVGRDGTKFPKMFCVKVPMRWTSAAGS